VRCRRRRRQLHMILDHQGPAPRVPFVVQLQLAPTAAFWYGSSPP
jgi:hypothetical protein